MKCPHCYCNFDDSERECPMCGTRASLTACRTDKHKSITYQDARRASPKPSAPANRQRPQASRTVNRHPSGNAAPHRPARTQPTYNSRSSQDAAEAAQKRRRKVVGWLIAAFALIQLIPPLTGLLANVMMVPTPDKFDNDLHFYDNDVIAAPEPAITPDDNEITMTEGILYSGEYFCADTGLTVSLDFSDQTYLLSVDDYLEGGSFFTLYQDPATDTDYYTGEFPAAEFESYVLYLERGEEWDEWDEDNEKSYTLVIAYIPIDGGKEAFFLNNTYLDARWLPIDRALLLELQ